MHNQIWIKKDFLETWKLSKVIPVLKPGKDTSNSGNYRLISLTLKRMVNLRLVWYLKTNNLITNVQCGYQKNRGCIDLLTNLESYIRDEFIRGEHVITLFFELEKAYDTAGKFGWLVGWLFGFYGISTLVGYLMPNPFLYK